MKMKALRRDYRAALAAIAVIGMVATGCRREERRFREMAPSATATTVAAATTLQPGPTYDATETRSPYQYNAYAISEGKALYNQFNCVGCHSNGGGGMGPPLMDDKWIYGSDPSSVFASIVEGRPNGMPTWRGRIPNYQVWRLVAYVRSMSGQASKDASSGRDDHLFGRESEQRLTELKPKNASTPPSREIMTAGDMKAIESALRSAGPQAGRIESLWWFMFWIATAVWVLVVAYTAYALIKGRRGDGRPLTEPQGESTMRRAVIAATSLTVLILAATLVYSVTTGSAMASPPRKEALRIKVVGHQWWWEVIYEDSTPSHQLTTANEIHVPVGEPVQIVGASRDVIHSLWAPNLFGKKDLIPGKSTALWFQADTPGVYRGMCAEFCGHQHAKMAVLIVAEPRPQFDSWYKSQLQPAAPPPDSSSLSGERVFMSRGCPLCHTVGGTRALGRIGPPLTHIGSSLTLAAGTLENNRGNLAGWIVDPQRIKPGVKMPPNDISGRDLRALLSYLESLK